MSLGFGVAVIGLALTAAGVFLLSYSYFARRRPEAMMRIVDALGRHDFAVSDQEKSLLEDWLRSTYEAMWGTIIVLLGVLCQFLSIALDHCLNVSYYLGTIILIPGAVMLGIGSVFGALHLARGAARKKSMNYYKRKYKEVPEEWIAKKYRGWFGNEPEDP